MGWGTSARMGQVQVVISVINIIIIIFIDIIIAINLEMVRYTDGSVAQGWVKEGAWHGVYRSKLRS